MLTVVFLGVFNVDCNVDCTLTVRRLSNVALADKSMSPQPSPKLTSIFGPPTLRSSMEDMADVKPPHPHRIIA